jgi:type II secretory pathway pseudopilin PulG
MVAMSSDERREMQELLGAYALDAVDDPAERARIEQYLATEPQARAEVAEFREVAALLAHAGTDAPVGVWDGISAAINADHGPPPAERVLPRDEVASRRRRRGLRIAVAIAAVAALVAVALGVKVAQQHSRIDRLTRAAGQTAALQRAMDAAAAQRDAQTVVLEAPDGARRARVVHLPDGDGYFADTRLPTLPDGRTYQLWALVGDPQHPTAISAGVLGPAPRVAAFRYQGAVVGFAVTNERSPGAVSPTDQPVAAGRAD